MQLNNYKYTAVNNKNKLRRGTIEAPSQELAFRMLKHKNLVVKKLKLHNTILFRVNNITVGRILNEDKLIFFLSQLGAILDSNINLLTAFELLAVQESNRHLRRMYFMMYKYIYEGYSLNDAMELYPKDFPKMLIRMVESSQLSGNLSETILDLSDFYRREKLLITKIKSAYRMPLIYLGATIVVALGLMNFVFPEIEDLFSNFETATLPGITQFFLALSSFINTNFYTIASILLGISFITTIIFKFTKTGKRVLTKLILNMPYIGELVQMKNKILIANTLSKMIANGVRTQTAFDATKGVVRNSIYLDIVDNSINNIHNGYPISKAFYESKYIDPIMAKMTEIGEETGEVNKMLGDLTNYYTETVEAKTSQIKATLQPILMLLIYAILGTLIIALMLPMIQLGTQI